MSGVEKFRVSDRELRAAVAAVLEGAGMPDDDAEQAADVLVAANLRGVDSHGAGFMLRLYVQWLRSGEANPRPRWRVLHEGPAVASIDADEGLGVVLAPRAMELAVSKARTTGIGMVCLHHGRHLGMGAYHALVAARHGMVGVCASATGPYMVPTGGREPRLGTNPLAVAVPAAKEPAFVFDAALTAVPSNKVGAARRAGAKIGPGLVARPDGTPVMEEADAPEQVLLLPLGSAPWMGSHKGYGLAAVVEILAGILPGAGFAARHGFGMANHVLLAIDPGAFGPAEAFGGLMDDFVRELKATPPAAGSDRVLVPGQLETETEAERRASGIPLDRDVWEWLEAEAAAAGEE